MCVFLFAFASSRAEEWQIDLFLSYRLRLGSPRLAPFTIIVCVSLTALSALSAANTGSKGCVFFRSFQLNFILSALALLSRCANDEIDFFSLRFSSRERLDGEKSRDEFSITQCLPNVFLNIHSFSFLFSNSRHWPARFSSTDSTRLKKKERKRKIVEKTLL